MNTMLRPNTPQQSSMWAPSAMSPGMQPTGSGVHRGVWIGGGLMALTIVALATALVMKSGTSPETVAQLPPVVAPVVTAPTPAPTVA
ncbi:MAG TPA: hypothetical protein VH328_04045, partial [Burkholderiaceae bacterium]|nr:hypothetical protein [Burkholderiaceae bacterium]